MHFSPLLGVNPVLCDGCNKEPTAGNRFLGPEN